MSIGVVSYSIAAVFFLSLLPILLSGRTGGLPRSLLIQAVVASTLWALGAAYQAAFDNALIVLQFLEILRDVAWLGFLLHMLSAKDNGKDTLSTGLVIVRRGIYAFTAVMVLSVVYLYFVDTAPIFLAGFDFQLAGYLLYAVMGLVLLEQVLRNIPADFLRTVKYLCFGVGGMFAYDFYLYSDALLFQRIDPSLWYARGFIAAAVAPVISIALLRKSQSSIKFFLSRRIVFHTSALLGSGIYLLAMGFGGYYVRDYGGTWGAVAQTIFLFGAGLLLLILLFSGPLRARLRVFINKHFFHYKYDYREEWLRFIRTLSSNQLDIPLPERAIRAIAQMIDSPGGLLWMRNEDNRYEVVANWNTHTPITSSEPANSSLIRFLEIQKWVINLDEYKQDPGLYRSLGDLEMPSWLQHLPDAWLIAPLILHDSLHGFVVLNRSAALRQHFNWEDCDLLKTTGSQAASHLAQHAASQALVEARQFEAFNRLSTYIVHDIKNLISQLSLVVSNAARHRNNPLFMENVISTVENSVAKMNRLLTNLRVGAQGNYKHRVDLTEILEEVVHDAQTTKPAPVFECHAKNIAITTDRDRFASVMSHVIRNAQEATPEDGQIVVRLQKNNGYAVIEVEDSGSGMDETFIHARLFRPFQTTKGSSGMGIGTYEAREFVRALGGDIHVESKPGKGTVFRINLPYEAGQEPLRRQGLH